MDRREAMVLSGSGSYYIQRPGSGQQTFHGSSQGFHQFSNSNSPFGSNPNQGGFVSPPLPNDSSPVESSPAVAPPPPTSGEISVKKKRGRPRKYGQDGSVSLALSPSVSPNSNKRGRGRPLGSGKKQRLASIGELMPSSSGMSFTPHVIIVSIGEDIASKVISFTQQGPRAICVLSASGSVSIATLLQPSPSHGVITYEGRFELISLSTSYLNTNDNEYPNRVGNLSVSLANSDGRVIGGGIGGPLVAASPVQVIVGSFIWAIPKVKIKKLDDDACEDVQDTNALDNKDNIAATSPPVGIWSTGPRSMEMHHGAAHIDIDLMRG